MAEKHKKNGRTPKSNGVKARHRANGNGSGQPVSKPEAVVEKVDLPVGFHPGGSSRWEAFWDRVIGAPRNLWDRSMFRHVALIPLLAWVGMGADGLSSSCYGPSEAYLSLGPHTYIAPLIAIATALTVFIISMSYSGIIESFPHGGGGYVVASKLLGPASGLVSGSALIIDYMLTITVSVVAGGDALFSFLPAGFRYLKMPSEIGVIGLLTILNLRGVKESVMAMLPIFFTFVLTHGFLLIGAMWVHTDGVVGTVAEVADGWRGGIGTIGFWGVMVIFLRAYSMGAGTYTGLEAVSNSMQVIREPRVANGKKTMTYMALSLSLLSAGLLVSYLASGIRPVHNQTLNATLAREVFGSWLHGGWTVYAMVGLTLLSEAGLLLVAAQTGFIGGPRVLSNLAVDSWLPKRFAAFSDRLTIQNGVLLYGVGSILTLLYTGGNIHTLIIMYSINVFITFSLSQLAMAKMWLKKRGAEERFTHLLTFLVGLVLCLGILAVMIWDKFAIGGWVTILVTAILCALCFNIRAYYRNVRKKVRKLDEQLMALTPKTDKHAAEPDPSKPTAILLVENYGGVGLHSLYTLFFKYFPGHFKNVVFVSIGVVNSGNYKGVEALQELREHVEDDLKKYVDMARRMGIPATYRLEVGTEVIEPAVALCTELAKEYRRSMVFGSKIIFQKPQWYHRLLHDETASAMQAQLQWEGVPMSILPVRLFN
jgi:amino acid transporter